MTTQANCSKGEMMKDIIVEFSGWVKISPEKAKFVYIGSNDMPDIDGFQWLALDEDKRCDYILESVIDVQRDCEDGHYDHIDVYEYDSI